MKTIREFWRAGLAAACTIPELLFAGYLAGMRDPGDVDRERGDVPGWVMITLMSAVLVAGLLAIAGPALENMFQNALDQVNQGR